MSAPPPLLDVVPPLPDVPSPPDAVTPPSPPESTPPAPSPPSPPPSSDSPPPAPPTPAPEPPSPPPTSDTPPPAPPTPAPEPPSPPPSSPPPAPSTPPPAPPSPPPSSDSPPPAPSTPAPLPPSPPPSSDTPPPAPSTPAPQPPSPPPSSNTPLSPPPNPSPPPPSPSPPPPSLPPPLPSPLPPSSNTPPPRSSTPPQTPSPSSPSDSSPPPPDSPLPSQSPPTPSVSSPTVSHSSSPPGSKSLESPPSPPVSQTLTPPPYSSSTRTTTNLVVGVAIGGVVVVAAFALLWVLFAKKKKRKDPHGTEGYYVPRDGFYASSAGHGQQSNPPSAEYYAGHKLSPPPVAAVSSISNSGGFSSTLQPLSASGSGGLWSSGSGPVNSLQSSSSGIVLGNNTSAFSYEEMANATNGFSNINLLGQGGFGYVYKGILPNGKIIAVKSLKSGSGQGEREFQAEVETISRVHHKHLVSLVGYCVTDSQKLLVYEYVENKTLEFHLHGKGQPVMDWPTRLRIAIGAAKGLAYLHEDCHPKIIHRDIKGANILLDLNYEAKVADFGLAKFTSDAETHISTRVMGTFGYMAPEYASSGKLTDKSDVFSFGVLLLELIAGRRPVDYTSQMEDSLVDWARPLLSKALQDGNFDTLVDPRLENNYSIEEMGCMITCAASCVRHSARRRPRLSQVVRALEGNLALSDLNDGVKPGFSSFQGSSDTESGQYKDDMQRFRKMVFASEDYNSSEFGRTTGEYRHTQGHEQVHSQVL